jgi:hypothetical protein
VGGNKKTVLLISSLLVVCLSLTAFSPACIAENIHPLTIENQTSQTLQIYVGLEGTEYYTVERYFHSGDVPANQTTTLRNSGIVPTVYNHFLIQARTDTDDVLFSEWYTEDELKDLDWTVVIPP